MIDYDSPIFTGPRATHTLTDPGGWITNGSYLLDAAELTRAPTRGPKTGPKPERNSMFNRTAKRELAEQAHLA